MIDIEHDLLLMEFSYNFSKPQPHSLNAFVLLVIIFSFSCSSLFQVFLNHLQKIYLSCVRFDRHEITLRNGV